MNFEEFDEWHGKILATLSLIRYRDWNYTVVRHNDDLFLQITFFADGKEQKCRMWYLWPGMESTGIVKTAWAATLAAEEHEAREQFRYRGVKVFNPHLDIDALVGVARYKTGIADTDDPS